MAPGCARIGSRPDTAKMAQTVASTWITPGCCSFWGTKNVLHDLATGKKSGAMSRAMKCQLIPAFLHQTSMALQVKTSMALQVNSVPLSETIEPGLPRRATIAASSRATRRPEIEVSGNPAEIKSEGETRLRLRTLLRAQSRRAFLLYNQAF
jgi:hypothetical protein